MKIVAKKEVSFPRLGMLKPGDVYDVPGVYEILAREWIRLGQFEDADAPKAKARAQVEADEPAIPQTASAEVSTRRKRIIPCAFCKRSYVEHSRSRKPVDAELACGGIKMGFRWSETDEQNSEGPTVTSGGPSERGTDTRRETLQLNDYYPRRKKSKE